MAESSDKLLKKYKNSRKSILNAINSTRGWGLIVVSIIHSFQTVLGLVVAIGY
ncbi:hypothetical protein [Rivularia sp. UHCC 0363]|uniref:hypothetical protein n=1 Tax=Rivularia sp. UHCC 0363 TaxID=3110244 RepID=UPI002B20797C|nr:hypothetical protein [Rivularia sp. UHCC 0363]MEA5598298.1 hypothetical protein [Rivularia sp. UHCC 0363]